MLRLNPLYQNDAKEFSFESCQMDEFSRSLFLKDKRDINIDGSRYSHEFMRGYTLLCWVINGISYIRMRPTLPAKHSPARDAEAIELFGEGNFLIDEESNSQSAFTQLKRQAEQMDEKLKHPSAKMIGYEMYIEMYMYKLIYTNQSPYNIATFQVDDLAYCFNLFKFDSILSSPKYQGYDLKQSCPGELFKRLAEKTTVALLGPKEAQMTRTISVYSEGELESLNSPYCPTVNTEYKWEAFRKSRQTDQEKRSTIQKTLHRNAYIAATLRNEDEKSTESKFENDLRFILETINKHQLNINLDTVPEDYKHYRSSMLIESIKNGYEKIVEILLNPPEPIKQANVNMVDDAKCEEGNTALMLAVKGKHKGIARNLLQHGANVNARNNNGDTAFILAAEIIDLTMMDLLLEYKADISIFNAKLDQFHDKVVNKIIEVAKYGYKKIDAIKEILRRYPDIITKHILKLEQAYGICDDDSNLKLYLFEILCHNSETFMIKNYNKAVFLYKNGSYYEAFQIIKLFPPNRMTLFNIEIDLANFEEFELDSNRSEEKEHSGYNRVYWKMQFAKIHPKPSIIQEFLLILINQLNENKILFTRFIDIIPLEILEKHQDFIKKSLRNVRINEYYGYDRTIWIYRFYEIIGNVSSGLIKTLHTDLEGYVLNYIHSANVKRLNEMKKQTAPIFDGLLKEVVLDQENIFLSILENKSYGSYAKSLIPIIDFLFQHEIYPTNSEIASLTNSLKKFLNIYDQHFKQLYESCRMEENSVEFGFKKLSRIYEEITQDVVFQVCDKLSTHPSSSEEFVKFEECINTIKNLKERSKEWQINISKENQRAKIQAKEHLKSMISFTEERIELKIDPSPTHFNQYCNSYLLSELNKISPENYKEFITLISVIQHLNTNVLLFDITKLDLVNSYTISKTKIGLSEEKNRIFFIAKDYILRKISHLLESSDYVKLLQFKRSFFDIKRKRSESAEEHFALIFNELTKLDAVVHEIQPTQSKSFLGLFQFKSIWDELKIQVKECRDILTALNPEATLECLKAPTLG